MSAASVASVSTVSVQETGRGSKPSAALRDLQVKPIPPLVAKHIIERHHYLGTYPGGTKLNFGVFSGSHLLGVASLGIGSFNAHRLVDGALPNDCLTFSRLWLADELPPNSESRVIGIILRSLRQDTSLKFLISYADPAQSHMGLIYQATNWLYTGLSYPTPLLDIGDGKKHFSRSLAHVYGSHSLQYLSSVGIPAKLIPQVPKHRYVFFLNKSWMSRLTVPILPYPKKEAANADH